MKLGLDGIAYLQASRRFEDPALMIKGDRITPFQNGQGT